MNSPDFMAAINTVTSPLSQSWLKWWLCNPVYISRVYKKLWLRPLDSQRKCWTNILSLTEEDKTAVSLRFNWAMGYDREMLWPPSILPPFWRISWGRDNTQEERHWRIPDKLSWSLDQLFLKVVLMSRHIYFCDKEFFHYWKLCCLGPRASFEHSVPQLSVLWDCCGLNMNHIPQPRDLKNLIPSCCHCLERSWTFVAHPT